MNYAYYKELRRKEMIKNTIFIIFILLFASISTYLIYNNFKDQRDEILKSNLIDVVYHNGNKLNITKITPVTDYVGLSTRAYTLTIKNNETRWVRYKISLKENTELVESDKCSKKKIPLNIIKVGIHPKGEVSKIYNLDDIEDGVLAMNDIAPKSEAHYTVRIWISENSVATTTNLHYHGLLEVSAEVV